MIRQSTNFAGLILFVTCFTFCTIQEKNTTEISAINLENHVSVLASDSLEGRGAGYIGERKAANYIAANFRKTGLLGFSDKGQNVKDYFQEFEFQTFQGQPWQKLISQNVVGFLEGDELSSEYIVVGGHHDGQGMAGMVDLGRGLADDDQLFDSLAAQKDIIWNSAVDNAVSIAVILEMARVIKENNIHLKRSVIFTTYSAEESGLDGSIYFVNNPPVSLEKIKAMINLEKIVGDPDAEFLYVSYGTSEVFPLIKEQIDSISDVGLTPFYPGMIADTDHYGFGLRSIPAITMGTGSVINVHQPLDHADLLDYQLLKSRADYIIQFLVQLANYDGDIEFSGELDTLTGVTGGMASDAEKLDMEFVGETAFKVASVVKDSKGNDAGIRSGDLIISVNGQPIPQQSSYQGLEDVIGEMKGDLELEIIRNGLRLTLLLE